MILRKHYSPGGLPVVAAEGGQLLSQNWSAAVKNILLVQPSSASAERVFSLLQNTFSKQQEAALEETVSYNDNKRT